ncbi:MAG: helix-turn-helix domain-containing protein [Candidatus Bathyarchaeia archaeon]
MEKQRYINIKETSVYTSIPIKTLYEWASIGRIPSIKIGRRVLFDLNDIDNIMGNLKRPYRQHEKTANKIIGDLHGNGI